MLNDKAIPLYYQLESILRQKILSGDFNSDVHLPSEKALGQEYNVSRITVRQALASLVNEGLITRRRGKGTFVVEKAIRLESPKFTGSMKHLISMGIKTTAKILDIRMIDAPKHIKDLLKHSSKTPVLRIEKIRLVEDSPFSYVLNYLPHHIGKRIRPNSLSGKPLLMILEDELGIKPVEAVQKVEATVADAHVASLLEIRVGDPLLKAERTVFDTNRRPVEYVFALYRADKYSFTMRLNRRKSEQSASWNIL